MKRILCLTAVLVAVTGCRQSAAIDVNQAAQLVTDGLLADEADFRSSWKSASGKDEWPWKGAV